MAEKLTHDHFSVIRERILWFWAEEIQFTFDELAEAFRRFATSIDLSDRHWEAEADLNFKIRFPNLDIENYFFDQWDEEEIQGDLDEDEVSLDDTNVREVGSFVEDLFRGVLPDDLFVYSRISQTAAHALFEDRGHPKWVADFLNENYLGDVETETYADDIIRSEVMDFINDGGTDLEDLISSIETSFSKTIEGEDEYFTSDQRIQDGLSEGMFWFQDDPYVEYSITERDAHFDVFVQFTPESPGPFLIPKSEEALNLVGALLEEARDIDGILEDSDTTVLWASEKHLDTLRKLDQ